MRLSTSLVYPKEPNAKRGNGDDVQNDKRRAAFIAAANELYEEKGIARTSIGDIANRVGVTRSLFYHYFDDKQTITDAVIESHVTDFMRYIRAWTVRMDADNLYGSIVGLARIVRTYLVGPGSFGSYVTREQNPDLFQRFVVRSSEILADYFVETRSERGAFFHITKTKNPHESLYVLAVGLMSLMTRRPDTTDEELADLIVDTLHVDLSVDLRKGVGPDADAEPDA